MDTAPTPTLTYFAVATSSSGRERRIAISLAYVGCIAGEAHYQPPPPAPKYFAEERREPVMTAKRIRRILGRDRAYSEKLKDRIGFEAATSRILRGGF